MTQGRGWPKAGYLPLHIYKQMAKSLFFKCSYASHVSFPSTSRKKWKKNSILETEWPEAFHMGPRQSPSSEISKKKNNGARPSVCRQFTSGQGFYWLCLGLGRVVFEKINEMRKRKTFGRLPVAVVCKIPPTL